MHRIKYQQKKRFRVSLSFDSSHISSVYLFWPQILSTSFEISGFSISMRSIVSSTLEDCALAIVEIISPFLEMIVDNKMYWTNLSSLSIWFYACSINITIELWLIFIFFANCFFVKRKNTNSVIESKLLKTFPTNSLLLHSSLHAAQQFRRKKKRATNSCTIAMATTKIREQLLRIYVK